MKKIWQTYLFPAVYGLVVYAALRLVNDIISDTRFWLRPWMTTAIELGVTVITGYVCIGTMRLIARKQAQKIIPLPVWKEYGFVALVITLISYCLIIPMVALTDNGLQWYDTVNVTLIPLLFAMLYYAIIRATASLHKNYEQQLLLEKISNDKLNTELRFLKAQFHPHFLFNALNTIYFQMDESVQAAKLSVEKLSELLRYQLYDQRQTVTIGQELQYLHSFIELQQQRMNEHLRLQVDFDPGLQHQSVYPLLLLPLVENAFKYAGGAYWINISAKLEDKQLLFHVSNAVPANRQVFKNGGIGQENLQRRLVLLYPNQHEFNAGYNGDHYTATLKIIL
ncbi:sensor histidine kinase [Chitinophaga sp. Hz27]|uniref:sensor histidine kinase n=1 Tax=Chitinophaga sp. Hz27 TaxID=3347169 RepID=UPI0035E150C2